MFCFGYNYYLHNTKNQLIMTSEEYIKWQDEVDVAFISNVQKEVTQSCALPFALPVDRIPAFYYSGSGMVLVELRLVF